MIKENTTFADRYQLIKLIGRGGFAEVWLAKDNKTNMEIALKIYAPQGGMDEEGVKTFMQEFALVFDLNHANLMRPSHFDEWNRMPYLVLPYCSKGSCSKLIGKMSEDEIWKFLRDVSGGLSYLHGKVPPIVHQDIKPDNILCNEDGCYFITDFGISTTIRSTLRKSVDLAKSGAGTLCYMAPERFGKDNRPIKASDIWSLGAMLYEIMNGDTPFGEHGGLLQKNGAETPDIRGEYSEELKRVVELCISKDSWDRPTAEQLFEYATNWIKGVREPFNLKETSSVSGLDSKNNRQTERKINLSDVDVKYSESNEDPKRKNIVGIVIGVVAFSILTIGSLLIFNGNSIKEIVEPVEVADIIIANEIDTISNLREINPKEIKEVSSVDLPIEQSDSRAVETVETVEKKVEKPQLQPKISEEQRESAPAVSVVELTPLEKMTQAANQGDLEAQFNLAMVYFEGKSGVKKDIDKAFSWLRKSSESGHALAQAHLGEFYEDGLSVNRNVDTAFFWYNKSANQGNDKGQFLLGVCYLMGEGVLKDEKKAVENFMKSANQGNSDSQFFLGLCYFNGEGVLKDEKKAVENFMKSASQNNANAQYWLAICYLDGAGIEVDNEKGLNLLINVANQDFVHAQFLLGLYYNNGSHGLSVNKDMAKAWFQKASDQGSEEAAKYLKILSGENVTSTSVGLDLKEVNLSPYSFSIRMPDAFVSQNSGSPSYFQFMDSESYDMLMIQIFSKSELKDENINNLKDANKYSDTYMSSLGDVSTGEISVSSTNGRNSKINGYDTITSNCLMKMTIGANTLNINGRKATIDSNNYYIVIICGGYVNNNTSKYNEIINSFK